MNESFHIKTIAKPILLLFICVGQLASCTGKKRGNQDMELQEIPATGLAGDQLAQIHCASCHLFVEPALLPKSSWANDVLPAMGHRLGIHRDKQQYDSLFDSRGGELVKKANIFPAKALLAQEDWEKIIDYYLSNAPDTILPPKRSAQPRMGLKHFTYREPTFSQTPALTTMVKLLPENKGVVFADGKRNINSLSFLKANLDRDHVMGVKLSPVHYREKRDTLYLTTVGKSIFPHDSPDGMLQKLYKTSGSKVYNTSKRVLDSLTRPVHVAYGDLNNNGLEDIVVCEYGNETGKLVWFLNRGGDRYERQVLNNRPGAITAIIKDMNGDGLQDVMALMAQGDEGVFYYENLGNGSFEEKRLLSFLPLNGSQYMELVDFNDDGLDDILYVCGDNADKTPILKPYHGVYIFLNQGNLDFQQSFFYPLNGAYKAIPRDYDFDGDLDIAAISFFPDYYSSPEESFVYLENIGNMKFEDFSFPEATNGRWIVMDAEDMDADGDIDIALGSFVYFTAMGDTTGLGKKWLSKGPSVVVLENTSR